MNTRYRLELGIFMIAGAWAMLAPQPCIASEAPAAGAAINGAVYNAGTKAFLEGALVELDGGRSSTTTTRDGTFTFAEVSAGRHTVSAFYTGLATAATTVEVGRGQTATVTLPLTDEIRLLEKFDVKAQQDGNAAAITKQRNSVNLTNLVSMDAYGNVNDGNIGNFLQKLPGVAIKREAGEIVGVGLRGTTAELNSVMLDGVRVSSAIAGFTPLGDRAPLIDQIPSESVKEIEVIKASTPEYPADSLAGGINMVTKSAFDYKERFLSYRLGLSQNLSRDTLRHKFGPNAAATFLDTFGPEQRWGLALTASYSKTYSFRDRVQSSFNFATDNRNSGARMLDDLHTRVRAGTTARIEYKLDPTVRVWADAGTNLFTDDAPRVDRSVGTSNREVADYAVVSRAAIIAGATPRTTTGTTAGIAPGFTDTHTEILNVEWDNNSEFEHKRSHQRKFGVGLEKKWSFTTLTISGSWSPSTYNNLIWGMDAWLDLPIGLSTDSTRDLSRPAFTQTYGPSIAFGSDLSNYTAERFATYDNTHEEVTSIRADADRRIRFGDMAVVLKAGGNYRHQYRWNRKYGPSWNIVGADGVTGINPATRRNDDGIAQFRLATPSYGLFNNVYPQFDWLDAYAFDRYFAANPQFFKANGTSVSYYPPKNIINETVSAGYAQATLRRGPFTVLGGLRYEATDVRAQGRLNDTGNPADIAMKTAGDYAKLFPSIHGRFEARRNLIARVSYSTSSARPRISDIVPTTSVSYTPTVFGRGLVTQANPSLRPQYSKNYDVALEYYFEPAGVLSGGWFHKDISDFITNRSPNPIIGSGVDNGFGGRYQGFELATKTNLNRATINGWEFNYVQRLVLLPGVLKNLSVYGNYTRLLTSSSPEVPPAPGTIPNTSLVDFTPFTYNLGLNYDSHRLGARVEYHFKSRLKTGNNTNPMLVQYMSPDATIDVNVNYRLRPNLTVFVDVINVFNESPYVYIGNTSRRQINEVYGTRVNAGLSGRF